QADGQTSAQADGQTGAQADGQTSAQAETVIVNTVTAQGARNNGVLQDADTDTVQTRVIAPFTVLSASHGLQSSETQTVGTVTMPVIVRATTPKTGDDPVLFRVGFGLLLAGLLSVALAYWSRLRKKARPSAH
ncbi:MAG: hypothetical protein FWF30_03115, partial [Coriobacteriia bacterium]|nr:hypothetical protein [Coriobacteriia bacterium]